MSSPANPTKLRVWDVPLIVAHRGASGEAPENTLAAFELALAQGSDGIEFDVHLSSDGIPMVIHDARLKRTTSQTGRVGRHPAAALERLDAGSWFNRRFPLRARAKYARCGIPPLQEVLEWVRARNCLAFLEIKQPRRTYPRIETKVLEHIYRAGVERLTTVISFHRPTLARVRRMDSRIALGIDFTRPILALTRARKITAGTLLPHGRFATARLIARAHRAGLRVIVWGLDEPLKMRRALSNGVDGIITSFPALLLKIREASRP